MKKVVMSMILKDFTILPFISTNKFIIELLVLLW